MGFDKFLGLHKHATRATAGLVDSAFVWCKHGNQQAHHAAKGIELPAVFAFRAGKLSQEILKDPTQHILGPVGSIRQLDGSYKIDQSTQPIFIKIGPNIVLIQGALETRVVALYGDHGIIHQFAYGGLFGIGLQMRPASRLGHQENILGQVFVLTLRGGTFEAAFALFQFIVMFLEASEMFFKEDEAEHNMLVLCGIQAITQLVSGKPELGFEADVGG